MYALVLCHRRRKDVRAKIFHRYWKHGRKRNVAALQSDLGFVRYTQVYQACRWNPIYRIILATRSRPIVSLISMLKGVKVPPKLDKDILRDERWDTVEIFQYESDIELAAAFDKPGAKQGAAWLNADQRRWSRCTAALVTEIFEANQDTSSGQPRIVNFFCLRRHPSKKTREDMLRYWYDSHRELVLRLQRPLGYRHYLQHHVRSKPDWDRLVGMFGENLAGPFDALAVLAYNNQGELIRGILNPFTLIANFKLVFDEVTFLDEGNSVLVYGVESTCQKIGSP